MNELKHDTENIDTMTDSISNIPTAPKSKKICPGVYVTQSPGFGLVRIQHNEMIGQWLLIDDAADEYMSHWATKTDALDALASEPPVK